MASSCRATWACVSRAKRALPATLLTLLPLLAMGVIIEPETPQTSINFDPRDYPRGNFEIPFGDPLIVDTRDNNMMPEQIRATYYGNEKALVSWATGEARLINNNDHLDLEHSSSEDPQQERQYKGAAPSGGNTTEDSSWVKWGLYSGAYTHIVSGITHSYSYTNDSGVSYVSGTQHHVILSELQAGRSIYYMVGDSSGHWSEERNFFMAGADMLLLVGDLSYADLDTSNSPEGYSKQQAELGMLLLAEPDMLMLAEPDMLMLAEPDMLMLVGDLSYADLNTPNFPEGYSKQQAEPDMLMLAEPDMLMLVGDLSYADLNTPNFPEGYSKQQAWDFFGRLVSRTLPHTLFMHTNGNHEVEPQATDNGFVHFEAYNARFPVPQNPDKISVSPVTKEAPSANLYYSVDVAGGHFVFLSSYIPGDDFGAESEQFVWLEKISVTLVTKDTPPANLYYYVDVAGGHFVFLSSYIPGDDFGAESGQCMWLEKDLAGVNREVTPWLIVSFHAPLYNSYWSHFKENECFMIAYEPLLTRYEVDITFHGHVHAYERTVPVNGYKPTDNGRLSITVGDGGNIEGVAVVEDGKTYKTFIEQFDDPFCKNPPQGPCLSFQPEDGGYCYTRQPEWSAFREASWGFGVLTLFNESVAQWQVGG
eukprot:gene25994-11685_t